MKLRASVAPYSTIVGSAVELTEHPGRLIATLAVMNAPAPFENMSDDDWRKHLQRIAGLVAERINGMRSLKDDDVFRKAHEAIDRLWQMKGLHGDLEKLHYFIDWAQAEVFPAGGSNGNVAVVIAVDHRYFTGYRSDGAVMTAWSLPGAKLFAPWRMDEVEAEITKIRKRRKRAEIYTRRIVVSYAPIEGGQQ
ncbi:hypothetical protein [Asticcacaulis solisilvae]|uniref:hypothetical protein n=1 Tax=Asticcacaulis solisilvae TaxID=1217274 RepID=UPI003FD75A9E